MFAKLSGAAIALALTTTAAFAEITVTDAYARSSAMMATSGAAFMVLHNDGHEDVTLIEARASGIAEKIELHTHIEDENGVMRMREVEGGISVPAHGETRLQRGGLHVMFLGLMAPFENGESFDLTLVFDDGEELTIPVPVDLDRQDAEGMAMPMDHGSMDHGSMDHGSMDHGSMDHGATPPATGQSN